MAESLPAPGDGADLARRLEHLSPERRALLLRELERRRLSGGEQLVSRRTGNDPAPLSYNQELLWRLEQSIPDLVAYNVPRVLRIRGALDETALRAALDALVARHEALRTRFVEGERGVRQVVGAPERVPFDIIDLGAVDLAGRLDAADQLICKLSRRRFDLGHELLLRATLIRMDATDHLLHLLTHHLVSDEASRGLLLDELAVHYAAARAGTGRALAGLPVQYSDYATWQRELVDSGALDVQLGYWRSQLRGVGPIDLPTDYPRSNVPIFVGERRRRTIAGVLPAIDALARGNDVTPYMLLLAAFQVLLHRWSGREDFAIGTPISGRRQVELEGLIGFFVNTLVLRADLAEDPTFSELLQRVKRTCIAAFEHQDVPFEKLVLDLRESGVGQDRVLIEASFLVEEPRDWTIEFSGAAVSLHPTDLGGAKFDITLSLSRIDDGLLATVEYRTDVFSRETIDRLLAQFELLVRGILR
ncbi:MAG: condensation domain-containing protein, partial [Gemmatimonadales bacterium]